MTGLLLDTELDVEQREFAETIQSSGDSLLTIINDILDSPKLRPENFSLRRSTLISTMLSKAQWSYSLSALTARNSSSLLWFTAMCRQRCVAIRPSAAGATNLIGNALKFTEAGEVVVRARKESENDESVVVRFTVSDSGIGISEAAQRNLSTLLRRQMVRLRASMAVPVWAGYLQAVVELMGGEIGVTSLPGHGSTFGLRVASANSSRRRLRLKLKQ